MRSTSLAAPPTRPKARSSGSWSAPFWPDCRASAWCMASGWGSCGAPCGSSSAGILTWPRSLSPPTTKGARARRWSSCASSVLFPAERQALPTAPRKLTTRSYASRVLPPLALDQINGLLLLILLALKQMQGGIPVQPSLFGRSLQNIPIHCFGNDLRPLILLSCRRSRKRSGSARLRWRSGSGVRAGSLSNPSLCQGETAIAGFKAKEARLESQGNK